MWSYVCKYVSVIERDTYDSVRTNSSMKLVFTSPSSSCLWYPSSAHPKSSTRMWMICGRFSLFEKDEYPLYTRQAKISTQIEKVIFLCFWKMKNEEWNGIFFENDAVGFLVAVTTTTIDSLIFHYRITNYLHKCKYLIYFNRIHQTSLIVETDLII